MTPVRQTKPDSPTSVPAAHACEFSRFYRVDAIGTQKNAVEITATSQECAALAQRFGLVEIAHLSARLHLRRAGDDGRIRVHGELTAQVVQTCVVTLEPVAAAVHEEFSTLFAPEIESDAARLAVGRAIDIVFSCDGEVDDDPEPLEEGGIDLGELVAQHLSLALDPYPRAPGVPLLELRETPEESDGEEVPAPGAIYADSESASVTNVTNPFAALARWRGGS